MLYRKQMRVQMVSFGRVEKWKEARERKKEQKVLPEKQS